MKRLWIFFILIVLAGGTGKALSSNNEAAKDSLLQILDTLPADSSRLEMLYSLAYLDPMSPSCVYYLGKLLRKLPHRTTSIISVLLCMPMSFITSTTKTKKTQSSGWTSSLRLL